MEGEIEQPSEGKALLMVATKGVVANKGPTTLAQEGNLLLRLFRLKYLRTSGNVKSVTALQRAPPFVSFEEMQWNESAVEE